MKPVQSVHIHFADVSGGFKREEEMYQCQFRTNVTILSKNENILFFCVICQNAQIKSIEIRPERVTIETIWHSKMEFTKFDAFQSYYPWSSIFDECAGIKFPSEMPSINNASKPSKENRTWKWLEWISISEISIDQMK